jgi:hypothetical protein
VLFRHVSPLYPENDILLINTNPMPERMDVMSQVRALASSKIFPIPL